MSASKTGSFETFLMASDLEDYVPAAKNGMLFFDKIHLNPTVEMAMQAFSWMAAEIIQGCPTRAQAEALFIMKLRKLPRALQRKYQSDRAFRNTLGSNWLNEAFQLPVRLEAFDETFKPQFEHLEKIKEELGLAVEAGFADFYLPPDRSELAGEIKQLLKPAYERLVKDVPKRFFGEEVTDKRDETRMAIGARQAALYSKKLNCSISSTNPQFLKFLSNFAGGEHGSTSDRKIWKAQFLAEKVLEMPVPNLQRVPLDEVVDVRKHVDKYVDYFRREIFDLAETIESEVWDREFERELRYLLTSKVRPKLAQAAHEWENALDRLFRALFRSKDRVFAGTLLASVTAYFTSLPAWLMTLIAAAFVIESSIHSFERLKDEAVARNGYGFLIEIEERLA